jgi:hypothetical protein
MQNFHLGFSFWLAMVLWSYGVYFVTALTIRNYLPIVIGSVLYAFLQMFLFTTFTGLTFAIEFSPRTYYCLSFVLTLWSNCFLVMRAATCMQICVHAMKAHSYWATNFTYRDVLAFAKNPDMDDHDLKHFPGNGPIVIVIIC